MSIITIILFFVYTYGFGFSVTSFFKNSDNFFERNLMRVGIGLGVLPFLFVLFDILHIPIDWRIILLISLAMPVIILIKNLKVGFKLPDINLNRSNLIISIVCLLFFLTLFMYLKGAFVYPYYEDDDPWVHATSIKFIAVEKNLDDPNDVLKYVKPYPPGYDSLIAILHQTSPSLMWTMKFFNALIAALGILFFYFFTKNFMMNKEKALFATIILAMIPSYLSHFIWAHSLAMTLLIVALYCLTMINLDKKWIYPTILVITGICLTQPTKMIKFFFIFMIYFIVKSIYVKKISFSVLCPILFGYALSLLWWGNKLGEMYSKQSKKVTSIATINSGVLERLWDAIRRGFPLNSGSASRPYTFSDFFIAKSQNMINNPVGIGVVLSLLVLFSLFVIFITYKSMKKEKKIWIATALFWLLFTFLGVNSMTFKFPIGFFAFRFWMLLAIPISIIAAEGFWFLVQFFKQFKIPKLVTIFLLIVLIFLTSGYQKFQVNTAIWPPGQMWTSMEEVAGYMWLKTLPVDTKVFAYSGDEQVIGLDKFSCLWCDDVINFRKDLIYKNVSELYDWLKKQRYEYFIFDGMAFRELAYTFGENKTNELLPIRIQEIGSFEKFRVAYQTKGASIFKVV